MKSVRMQETTAQHDVSHWWGAQRSLSLQRLTFDDAMENGAVVITILGMSDEVFD